MKATINDIAKACGVSKGLVSRVLNQDPSLKCGREVRQRIFDEVERQGYIPDYYARQLSLKTVNGKTKRFRIGYVSYTAEGVMGHPYFDKIIEGLVTELNDSNCDITAGMDIKRAYALFRAGKDIEPEPLDGLILFGEIDDPKFYRYLKSQTKYLMCMFNTVSDDAADFVGCDYNETIRLMLICIKQHKYDKIGLMVGDNDIRSVAAPQIAKEEGLDIDEAFFLKGYFSTKSAHESLAAALEKAEPPKVICCLNDEMAIGCIDALNEAGYRVPEDVSVTGHDDISRASYSIVPLTTVRIYKEELGKLAVTVLRERLINKRKFGIKVYVPGKLVKRMSLKMNSTKGEQ